MSIRISLNMKNKKCTACEKVLPLESFAKSKNGKLGRHSRCRECSSEYDKKYNEINRQRRLKYKAEYRNKNRNKIAEYNARPEVKERQKRYNETHREKLKNYRKEYHAKNLPKLREKREQNLSAKLQYLFTARRSYANRKSIPFTITLGYLIRLANRQKLKCAVTGINFDMIFSTDFHRNAFGLSIDRIIPKNGYVPRNVQLVCSIVNMAKSDFTQEIFDQMCRARVEMLNGS